MLRLDIRFLDSILQQNRIAFVVRLLLSEVLLGRGCESADMPGELGRLPGLAQGRGANLKAACAVRAPLIPGREEAIKLLKQL